MYVATINTPGYSPQDDDPPTFDTAAEAWAYLAGEREQEEQSAGDGDQQDHTPDCPWNNASDYTDTWVTLRALGDGETELDGVELGPDGVGSIVSDTPGMCTCHGRTEMDAPASQSIGDLGRVYSVSVAEEEPINPDHPEHQVHTWADGFGLWHARVTVRSVGHAPGVLDTARIAIANELRERGNAATAAWLESEEYQVHYVGEPEKTPEGIRYEFIEASDHA